MMNIHDIEPTNFLAASVTSDGNVVDTSNPVSGDADDAAARELFDDDFDISKFLWTVLFLLFSITMSAQSYTTVEPADAPADGKTHGMTLYLKNDTQVTYELQELSHVTYLPGVGMKVYLKNATTSVDYLFQQMNKIDYAQDGNDNANWKDYGWADYPEAWRLEYPHLSANVTPTKEGAKEKSQIIVKRTDDYGITFSLEWDNAKVANRWTCYELHAGNTLTGADRNDDFKADPEVAVSPTLDDYKNSGFSRGHLCPSADRQCSKEQNKQTFYISNAHPQYQNHNGNLWQTLENKVNTWGNSNTFRDTLYVVKAGTVDGDKVLETTSSGLLVPKYFYMALLHYNKETDSYHSIAFWTDHIDGTQSVKNLADYAISIEELQNRTGIDFFCNLPDDIEKNVEENLTLSDWGLKKTGE